MDKTGGPAFPSDVAVGPSGDVYASGEYSGSPGMTLLDYFAAAAMTAYWSADLRQEPDMRAHESHVAAIAYAIADAMLAEKARREAEEK